jgi:hypothetical protein
VKEHVPTDGEPKTDLVVYALDTQRNEVSLIGNQPVVSVVTRATAGLLHSVTKRRAMTPSPSEELAAVARPLLSSIACLILITTEIATAAALNDTGQTQCYNDANLPVTCSATVGGDSGANPRQDGRYGRDPQATSPPIPKTGAGSAGFDYSKIANNGLLSTSASIGTNPTDWACTKDNVTGLVWEVKTTSGLRNGTYTYTWYSNTASTNGGVEGGQGASSCGAVSCNTQSYVAAVNAAGMCGASDWRLPTRKELLTLVNAGLSAAPLLDTTYFPNTSTLTTQAWTASTHAIEPSSAWYVDFFDGGSYGVRKANNDYAVRLVRTSP